MAPERSPAGIRFLKVFCLFVSISALVELIYWISGQATSSTGLPENNVQRAISVVLGLSFGPFFYAVSRRLAVAWKIGWAILIATFSWTLAETLTSILKHTPGRDGWVGSAVATIMLSAVA